MMTREQILAMTDEELANYLIEKMDIVVIESCDVRDIGEYDEDGICVGAKTVEIRNLVPLASDCSIAKREIVIEGSVCGDDPTGFHDCAWLYFDANDREMWEKMMRLSKAWTGKAKMEDGEEDVEVVVQFSEPERNNDDKDLGEVFVDIEIANPDLYRRQGETYHRQNTIVGPNTITGFISYV